MSNRFAAGPPQGEAHPPGGQRSTRSDKRGGHLILFDLDHTLLAGDSDVLWCAFLIAEGILDAGFAQRNAEIEAQYKAGTVDPVVFADFYVSTLAGKTPQQWEPLRQKFLSQEIVPRIPAAARELVERHHNAGDVVVMTTATNRFITELTAAFFGIDHLLATEPELINGRFSGATTGVLNMRAGKVARLHDWLQARGNTLSQFVSTGYSDSINDLPLLEAVNRAVVVNADPKLAPIAAGRGWDSLSLRL
jgi:HAD superfamily hydrolase (TIGR01490 family)